MKPIRVLIIDDSLTMRKLIAASLRRDPAIEVVGEAADAIEGRQAIKALNPDVITLDVEMPKMNGLDFLEKIMRLRPMPVIMLSNMTTQGASASIEALAQGAFDCIAKPQTADDRTFNALIESVKSAAGARMQSGSNMRGRGADLDRTSVPEPQSYHSDGRIVAIGASTGGVEALITILSSFPADCPPTVITQHMPPVFTSSFAKRLDRLCAPRVSEATDETQLSPGHVLIAPGGPTHMEVVLRGGIRWCKLRQGDLVNGHRPSVDVLFASLATAVASNAVGVILTGMGRDGAQGLLSLRNAGAHTLGQDEGSSVVYGMPKAAWEVGAVQKQVPLNRIALEILSATNSKTNGQLRCRSSKV
jgi:two-component system chemotaxis response regulator CheB